MRFSSDHMQVQLRNDIANGGEIDLWPTERCLDEVQKLCRFGKHRFPLRPRQIEEIHDIGWRHQNEPGKHSVLVQQHVTERKSSESVAIG